MRWSAKLPLLLGYSYAYDTRRSEFEPERGLILLEFGQDFAGLGGDAEVHQDDRQSHLRQRLVF